MKKTSFGRNRFYYRRKYGLNDNPLYLIVGFILTITVLTTKNSDSPTGFAIVMILFVIFLITEFLILSDTKTKHKQRLRTYRDLRRRE